MGQEAGRPSVTPREPGVHFALTMIDSLVTAKDEPTTEYDEVVVEFQTYDAIAATIIASSRLAPEDGSVKHVASLRMSKQQVGALLAFLSAIHPLMELDDDD